MSRPPLLSGPAGNAPGRRLAIVRKVVRAEPWGRSDGKTTKPGCSGKFGWNARHATSDAGNRSLAKKAHDEFRELPWRNMR